MSTQVQIRKGNTIQTAAFTGAIAEITVDTDKKTLVVHDGVTAGGIPLARESSLSANAIFSQAAFNAANSAATLSAATDLTQNNSITAAFLAANSAVTLSAATDLTQNTNITNAQNTGDAAFLAANSAATLSAATDVTQNNSITAAFLAGNTAATLQAAINTTQNTNIINAQNTGDAAFTTANNALPKAGGGTITGDLVITGNLTTSGTRTYANTTNVQLGDNIITLNAEIPSGLAPTENAGFEVNRGSSANVSLIWNEANDNWTATNDGSYFYVLADAAVDATQNASITTVTNTATAAFLAANSAATLSAATDATQNNSIAAAFNQANTDFTNVSVAAGTYGNTTHYGVVTVSANGRVTAVQTFVMQDPSALAFSIALG